MDSSKIEVGDVFINRHRPVDECVATGISPNGWILCNMEVSNLPEDCTLVRKADRYHGIALPEPPAGYRLAKWGEVADQAMYWTDTKWSQWGHLAKHAYSIPVSSIFAITLDQPSPLKSWQFREVPWVVPEPKTLADVPEGEEVIGAFDYSAALCVVVRRGANAYWKCATGSETAHGVAAKWKFIRYLDPPPQKPLSLDDVPDGRVILFEGQYVWRVWPEQNEWMMLFPDGAIRGITPDGEFTITNYIAEFRGPA